MKQLNTLLWALHKGLIDGIAGQHCAHGNNTIGEAFGSSNNIGSHPKPLGGERCADATKGGNYLIKN